MKTGIKHNTLTNISTSLKFKNSIIPWLFVLPALAFTFIFRYYNMGRAFWISLHNYDIGKPPGDFIWFGNYIVLIKDPNFWNSVKNTFIYIILTLVLVFIVPIIQAIFLSELDRGRGIFSSLYLIPAVIPLSVTVILWKWIFNPNFGIANSLMDLLGLPHQAWYSDPGLTKFCIVLPGIIGGGFVVLLYLSAIMGISRDLYESAQIDGCSGFKKLYYITLPNISFMIMIQLIMTVVATSQILDSVFQFTLGGPNNASASTAYYSFDLFNNRLIFGKSTAAAFIMMFFIAIITAVQLKLDKSERE